jgi:hypothetical protein
MLINQVFQDVLKSFETRTLYDQLCQFRPVSATSKTSLTSPLPIAVLTNSAKFCHFCTALCSDTGSKTTRTASGSQQTLLSPQTAEETPRPSLPPHRADLCPRSHHDLPATGPVYYSRIASMKAIFNVLYVCKTWIFTCS